MFEERLYLSPSVERFERNIRQQVDSFREYLEVWERRIEERKSEFPYEAAAKAGHVALNMLEQSAQELERQAERRAVKVERLKKRTKRDVANAFKTNPEIGAVLRSAANELILLDTRVVENMLDFALWLRASRSMSDPDAQGGEAFKTPTQLKRFLDRELA